MSTTMPIPANDDGFMTGSIPVGAQLQPPDAPDPRPVTGDPVVRCSWWRYAMSAAASASSRVA